ncbi:MAG: thiamine phosphate synthase [Acidobacteriota bacterium]|nr:thiamine phosphate synthase [Acidobacteriota bacterium]
MARPRARRCNTPSVHHEPATATAPGDRRRARLGSARLYLVCDASPPGRTLDELLREALAGGVDVVQLRDKRLGDRELAGQARRARSLCAEAEALLIVNDRPEVALASGADGVHVGQEDMPVERVRALVGEDLLVGLSTHTPRDVDEAAGRTGGSRHLADYIGVGPVFATPTKPGRAPVGTALVRHAAAHCELPFFAIGGIDRGNVTDVLAAGAGRIAVLRAIASAADPGCAARELRDALDIHGNGGRSAERHGARAR